jgi:protein tyrosine/serine phosphatase
VLSVYGVSDQIVPLEDAAKFANAYNGRHELQLITGADHNFYGGRDKDTGKKVNFNPQVAQIISDWFQPDADRERFLRIHRFAGTFPRFVEVKGVNNFRDFGGYKTDPRVAGVQYMRHGLLYRAANLARINEEGMATMRRLGIKTVFDFRSDPEVSSMGLAVIPGIEVCRNPVFRDKDLSPEAMAARHSNYYDPMKGFHLAYREILAKASESFRNVFLHLRDRPGDAIVVHCTAGKDRTGVFCMLVQLLMGVAEDTIARDYELTTVGLKPEIQRIMSTIDSLPDVESEAMRHMLSSRYEAMVSAITMLNEEFGGVVRYLKDYCRFSDRDIATIRANLAADGQIRWPANL